MDLPILFIGCFQQLQCKTGHDRYWGRVDRLHSSWTITKSTFAMVLAPYSQLPTYGPRKLGWLKHCLMPVLPLCCSPYSFSLALEQ